MTILILSDTDDLMVSVREAVGDLVGISTTAPTSDSPSIRAEDVVVILDGRTDIERALRIAQHLDDNRPEVTVVLCSEPAPGVFFRAMQAGIRDIFEPESDGARIREAVKRAVDVAERRQEVLRQAENSSRNRLIMVMSPKGGAGKTTIATNLALGLATRLPKQVVLVDGDLQFGDVANALRLMAETSVRDAITGGLQDVTEVKVHLTSHRSGLFALCAPDLPGVADEITAPAFSRAVSLLSSDFPFVVVDTDPGLGERTLAVMDHATDLVFVAATDVASVRGLYKTIDALDRIGLNTAQRHFVLNRSDAKVGLEISDIAATIGMTPDVLIPSHRSMPIALNQGSPILETPDGSPTEAPLWQLVDRFYRDPNASDESLSLQDRRTPGLWRRNA